MDPLSALVFSVAVTWWIKHFGENGHAEYEHVLGQYADAVKTAHPNWSARRVQRHAKSQARAYWWNQAMRGFPDWRQAREADIDTVRARWAEEQLNTAMRRREAWRRIRDAKTAWDRLWEEERQAREADAERGQPDTEPAAKSGDVIDAEIVDDGEPTPAPPPSDGPHAQPARREPPQLEPPKPPARPAAEPAASKPATAPPSTPTAKPAVEPQATAPTVPAANGTALPEGDPMPPRSLGHIIPRNGSAPATRGGAPVANPASGEAWTHGDFERAVATIQAHLADLPTALEAMLRDLRLVDAGKTQVEGVMHIYRETAAFIHEVETMLRESNVRARPVVAAVANAGGPDEVAAPRYYRAV